MKCRKLPAVSMKNDSSDIRCKRSLQFMYIGNHSLHNDLASVTEASSVKTPQTQPAFVAPGSGCASEGWRLSNLHQMGLHRSLRPGIKQVPIVCIQVRIMKRQKFTLKNLNGTAFTYDTCLEKFILEVLQLNSS